MVEEAEAKLKSKQKKEENKQEEEKEAPKQEEEITKEVAVIEQNEDGDLVVVAAREEVKERVGIKPDIEKIKEDIDQMLEDEEIPIPEAKLDILTTINELKNQLIAHITENVNKLYELDCQLAKAEADVERAQRKYDEAQMKAHNQTKNTPLDLKNLLQVATIVGDTAESIKLNNIFNEVLPSTCKSITTYVSIATDAWKGDNVLEPTKALDPSKTSIPELDDPDDKKVKKRIKEDTEEWFTETALDEDGNEHEECYTNLQVLF